MMLNNFKNKQFFFPSILCFIYISFAFLTYGKWGHVISDSFREAIIPQAMLQGAVLYKDITNLYPPLAYQFNEFLFFLFGCNLNVLYISAIICGFISLSTLFLLIKKYSSSFVAFITCLSIMEFSVFRICIYNSASWFFPYSYSFIYSFCFCILAIYFYFCYLSNKSEKNILLSSFFFGVSIACKWDFILFILLLLVEIIKNKSFKQFILFLSLILLPSFFSIGIYLLSNGSLSDLLKQVDFLISFSHSKSLIIYNKIILQQAITIPVLKYVFLSFLLFVTQFFVFAIISILSYLCNKKIKNVIAKLFFIFSVVILSYIFVLIPFAKLQFDLFGINRNFLFIPYFLFLCVCAIFVYRKKYNQKFLVSEKVLCYLVLIGFIITYREWAAVTISYIGNWTILIYWAGFVFLLLKIFPSYFLKLNYSLYNMVVSSSLIAFCGLLSIIYFSYFLPNYNNKIETSKGVFYTTVAYSKTINDTLEYINKYIPQDKSVLVLEEGLIFNWFSNRKTDLQYYALIPHFIDTWNEQNIIDNLKKKNIDYILITNNKYPLVGFFGVNYAKNITQFIFDNYYYEKSIVHPELPSSFEITVLKYK
jgi:hypothetical protein